MIRRRIAQQPIRRRPTRRLGKGRRAAILALFMVLAGVIAVMGVMFPWSESVLTVTTGGRVSFSAGVVLAASTEANPDLGVTGLRSPGGENWLTGYSYRKEVVVDQETGAGTDYQVLVTLDSDGGTANVDLEGHCTDFPNDIRYTDDDGSTELEYAILDLTADPITVRIKVTDDLSGEGTVDIYVYYGKAGEQNDESWPDTFIAGTDFDFTLTPAQDLIHACVYAKGYVFMCTRDDNDIGVGAYVMRYNLDGSGETVQQLAFNGGQVSRLDGGCFDGTYLWWAGYTNQTDDSSYATLVKMNPSDMSDYTVYTCAAGYYEGRSVCTDGTYVYMVVTAAEGLSNLGRVAKLNISLGTFTYYAPDPDSLYGFYFCIYDEDDSLVWIAGYDSNNPVTGDGLLIKFDPSDGSFTDYTIGASASHRAPTSLAYDGTYVWEFSAVDKKYIKFDKDLETYDSYDIPAAAGTLAMVVTIYSEADGYIWLATHVLNNSRLYRITPSDGSIKYMMKTINYVHAICLDPRDRLWLGNFDANGHSGPPFQGSGNVLAQRISMPAAGFIFEGSGTYEHNTSDVSGVAEIDLGTTTSDAGILVTKNALANLNFEVANRIKAASIGNTHFAHLLALSQKVTQPTTGTAAATQPDRRIVVRQYSDGNIQIIYWDSTTDAIFWDEDTEWNTNVHTSYSGAVNTYYIVKLISTSTSWKVRIENDSGALLQETDTVNWADMLDDSNDYWIWCGVIYTNAYYADFNIKEFYIRKHVDPEPAFLSTGSEEEYVCLEDITNTPSSHDFGNVSTSSTHNTTINKFTVTNNSGGAIDITISAGNMTGGIQWTLSDTATPGANTYGLKAGLDDDDDLFDVIVKKSESYNTLVSGLADEGTADWGLQLLAPTVFADGVEKTGTVTLTATCN